MKKTIIITSLILLALTLTGYYIKSDYNTIVNIKEEIESDLIDERSFFKAFDKEAFQNENVKKLSAPQIPPILSYKFEHHIFINQLPMEHG